MASWGKRLLVSLAMVLASLGVAGDPAAALPGEFVYLGTATTGPVWFPVSPFCLGITCPANNAEVLNPTLVVGTHLGRGNVVGMQTQGQFAYCALSTPRGGTVTVTDAAGPLQFLGNWVNGTFAGFTTDGAHGLVLRVEARPIVGNCLTAGATQWLVTAQGTMT